MIRVNSVDCRHRETYVREHGVQEEGHGEVKGTSEKKN
jgi:hypothetical protein